MEPASGKKKTCYRWGILIAALVVLGAGIGVWAISTLPFDFARSIVDSHYTGGSVDFLTGEFYRSMVLRLRFYGIFLVLIGVVAVLFNRRLADQTAGISGIFREAVVSEPVFSKELRKIPAVALVLVAFSVILGLVVRLTFLQEPIRYDEAVTYLNYASFSPLVTLSCYLAPNNHILHSLLVLLSTRCFGPGEWAIRLPALVAGVLLIPAVFVLGRKLGSYRTGLWAVALTAASSYLVEYSVNGRGYTMVCLFTILLLIAARSVRKNPRSVNGWSAFVLFSVIGLTTVPTMLYSICLATAWYLLGADIAGTGARRSPIRSIVLSLVIIGLGTLIFYTPAILVSGPKAVFANEYLSPLSLREWALRAPDLVVSLASLYHRDLPLPLVLLLAGGFILGVFRTPKLAAAFLTVGLLMLLQRVVPFERVLLFLLPVYLTVAAAGLSAAVDWMVRGIGRKHRGEVTALLALVWLLAASFYLQREKGPTSSEETGFFPEAKKAAEFLSSHPGPDEKIRAVSPSNAPLKYYCTRLGVNSERFELGKPDQLRPKVVYLIVNLRYDRLEELIERFDLISPAYRPPRLVFLFRRAAVYRLEASPV